MGNRVVKKCFKCNNVVDRSYATYFCSVECYKAYKRGIESIINSDLKEVDTSRSKIILHELQQTRAELEGVDEDIQ